MATITLAIAGFHVLKAFSQPQILTNISGPAETVQIRAFYHANTD
jgi:hypothetical protein